MVEKREAFKSVVKYSFYEESNAHPGLRGMPGSSLAGCAPAATPTATSTAVPPTPLPSDTSTMTIEPSVTTTLTVMNTVTQTVTDTPVPTETVTPTTDPRLPPEQWQEWPVIPYVSPDAIAIYRRGLEMGNDPHSFSKIGDCQSVPTHVLMGIFDDGRITRSPKTRKYLQETIDHWFAGSFYRDGMAVNGRLPDGDPALPLPRQHPILPARTRRRWNVSSASTIRASSSSAWKNGSAGASPKSTRVTCASVLDYAIEMGVRAHPGDQSR